MALIQCPECQREVSDQAPSCLHCGYPLKQPGNISEPQWETCHIRWGVTAGFMGEPLAWSENYFWAQAVFPVLGTYSAGCSHNFGTGFQHKFLIRTTRDHRPPSWDNNAVKAFQELADLLVQEGWEQTPHTGREWWQHSFRRRPRTDEEGWFVFSTTPKWDGRWTCDPNVSSEEVAAEPEFQQELTAGNIRNDGHGYWFREEWLIEWLKEKGGQFVSNIPIHHDGSRGITFKMPKEENEATR